MVFGRPELGPGEVLEHRSTRTGRWLRERRLRVALWIAVIEGILVVFHVISWPVALVIAVAVVVLYFGMVGRLRSDGLRQLAWIAAVSQALVALVPVLVIIVGTLALILVAILAVVALVLLLSDRR
jgi:vacuolar-type H+-ATPase subunit I/STV1